MPSSLCYDFVLYMERSRPAVELCTVVKEVVSRTGCELESIKALCNGQHGKGVNPITYVIDLSRVSLSRYRTWAHSGMRPFKPV